MAHSLVRGGSWAAGPGGGQDTGQMPAGEAGQAGVHLPSGSADDRQVPKRDAGLPAELVDEGAGAAL